jgi:hypothetical protein
MPVEFKLKEIADIFGGDEVDKYRRLRALGRTATGISRVDAPSLFRPKGSLFAHKTSAKLYDRSAVSWASIFFYLTEILQLEEVIAKSDAMPSMESIALAFDAVAKGEAFDLIVECEAYWDGVKQYYSQICKSGEKFTSRCSENPKALISKSVIPLNQIWNPLLNLKAEA